jgi:hypothetical protein
MLVFYNFLVNNIILKELMGKRAIILSSKALRS